VVIPRRTQQHTTTLVFPASGGPTPAGSGPAGSGSGQSAAALAVHDARHCDNINRLRAMVHAARQGAPLVARRAAGQTERSSLGQALQAAAAVPAPAPPAPLGSKRPREQPANDSDTSGSEGAARRARLATEQPSAAAPAGAPALDRAAKVRLVYSYLVAFQRRVAEEKRRREWQQAQQAQQQTVRQAQLQAQLQAQQVVRAATPVPLVEAHLRLYTLAKQMGWRVVGDMGLVPR
jgi:hypothetical protein